MRQRQSLGKMVLIGLLTVGLAMLETAAQSGELPSTVSAGRRVSVEYTLTLDDQTVFETNVGEKPLTYTHGEGKMVPGLEKALEGMAVGDTKQVTVTPAEGYGPVDPEAVQEVEKQRLPPEALHVGAQLAGTLPDGRMVYPRVAAIKTDTVVLDFNHPLAGKTLHFDVKILAIADDGQSPLRP
jgi:FKBP-type peptidyl-prolyl cis-trans isomerase SlyD